MKIPDAFYNETWDDVHDCKEKTNHHAQDSSLGLSLGVFPEDAVIYKTNGEWWIRIEEFYLPILCCPFCATSLKL